MDPLQAEDKLPVGRRLAGIGVGLAAVGAFAVLSRHPALAEWIAGSGPLPGLVRLLSLSTGWVPISLAEVVVLVVVGRQIHGLTVGIAAVRRGERRPGRAALAGGLRLGQDVGILVALLVVLWGVQHARPGLEDRLGIALSGRAEAAEIEPLARRAVELTNALYLEVHGVEDAGHPTEAAPRREIVRDLEAGWERLAERPGIPDRVAARHGTPKSFWTGRIFRRFGVAGMYFPYTGEALVLRDLPGMTLPRDLAHEMAHQRGFASESDANALAFLVAREAEDPRVRYAAYAFLQDQLLGALQRVDRGAASELRGQRLPGVLRDLQDRAEYWSAARGWTRTVGQTVNHAMLRAHGVREGIASYQGSVWVFVALAREEGPEALFPPEGSQEAPGA